MLNLGLVGTAYHVTAQHLGLELSARPLLYSTQPNRVHSHSIKYINSMPRRPPPSSLRLHPPTDPLPKREEPKHRMPSAPQPAFVPDATTKSEGTGPSKPDIGKIGETAREESSNSNVQAGPWDRSRSFREGEMSVGELIRPPAVAASLSRP